MRTLYFLYVHIGALEEKSRKGKYSGGGGKISVLTLPPPEPKGCVRACALGARY